MASVMTGYRDTTPVEMSYDGTRKIVDILDGVSRGSYGDYEALHSLMEERYVNRSITDDQYKLAVKKVQDPYPKYISETLKGIDTEATKSGGYLYNRGFMFGLSWIDKDEQKLHSELMDNLTYWMEDEKGRMGKYPEPEEMYKQYKKSGVLIDIPKVLPKAPPVVKAPPKRDDPLFIGVNDDAKFESIPVGTVYYEEALGIYVRKKRD